MELHNLKDDSLKSRGTIAKTFSFETATFVKCQNKKLNAKLDSSAGVLGLKLGLNSRNFESSTFLDNLTDETESQILC